MAKIGGKFSREKFVKCLSSGAPEGPLTKVA